MMAHAAAAEPTTPAEPMVIFNPFDPEFQQDPYQFYDRAHRAGQSVVAHPLGVYFIVGYPEVAAMLKHTHGSKDFEKTAPGKMMLAQVNAGNSTGTLDAERKRWVLDLDGAEHQRIRSLIAKAFNRRAVDALKPKIYSLVDDLLATPLATGRTELIHDIALPLPTTVICELLKLPDALRAKTDAWSVDITKTFDLFVTPEVFEAGDRALYEFVGEMTELVEQRRKHPEDGLIDAFIAVEEAGQTLSTEEIISNSIFLFGAGHETTTNLIGNGLFALLQHPEQLQKLREQPELIDSAIEEMLRFNSPVQMTTRTTEAEIELGGVTIPKHSLTACMLGAGNRDPRIFTHPGTLNIERDEGKALSFGGGAHYCIGAMLARLEARAFFEALLAGTSTIEVLTEQPHWRSATNLRGLDELELALS